MINRNLGPEAGKEFERRVREGFFEKYLGGSNVLDVGYQGPTPNTQTITENATGVGLDYPGYDGRTLPFADQSQDSVFASHILEHVDDYKAVLADWYRVLKVGGYLIVAVPHSWLYERKAAPPSRFNGDHKRFYTPASLLREVEDSLPIGGYRIRHLKDVDDGFDYSVQPQFHARGSYEIELVVQKIAIPSYTQELELDVNLASHDIVLTYADLLKKALHYDDLGHSTDLARIVAVLSSLPLPPFAQLVDALDASWRQPKDVGAVAIRFHKILRSLIAAAPFNESWYLHHNPGVAQAVAQNQQSSGHGHYIEYGYFEGREPGP